MQDSFESEKGILTSTSSQYHHLYHHLLKQIYPKIFT